MNLNSMLTDLQYYCNRKDLTWSYKTVKQILEKTAWITRLTGNTELMKSVTSDIDKILINTGMKEKLQLMYKIEKESKRND